jgi:hypothetical protein
LKTNPAGQLKGFPTKVKRRPLIVGFKADLKQRFEQHQRGLVLSTKDTGSRKSSG